MKARAEINPSLLRPGGVIGRRDYFVNLLISVGLLGFSLGYLTLLEHVGFTASTPHESPLHAALVLVAMLPAPIAAFVTVYALLINMVKRVRDLAQTSRGAMLWGVLLIVPIVGTLAQAALLLREGASRGST